MMPASCAASQMCSSGETWMVRSPCGVIRVTLNSCGATISFYENDVIRFGCRPDGTHRFFRTYPGLPSRAILCRPLSGLGLRLPNAPTPDKHKDSRPLGSLLFEVCCEVCCLKSAV